LRRIGIRRTLISDEKTIRRLSGKFLEWGWGIPVTGCGFLGDRHYFQATGPDPADPGQDKTGVFPARPIQQPIRPCDRGTERCYCNPIKIPTEKQGAVSTGLNSPAHPVTCANNRTSLKGRATRPGMGSDAGTTTKPRGVLVLKRSGDTGTFCEPFFIMLPCATGPGFFFIRIISVSGQSREEDAGTGDRERRGHPLPGPPIAARAGKKDTATGIYGCGRVEGGMIQPAAERACTPALLHSCSLPQVFVGELSHQIPLFRTAGVTRAQWIRPACPYIFPGLTVAGFSWPPSGICPREIPDPFRRTALPDSLAGVPAGSRDAGRRLSVGKARELNRGGRTGIVLPPNPETAYGIPRKHRPPFPYRRGVP